MYKCTECNAIFEQCPDFCDCGNDIFMEITDETSVQNTTNTVYVEPPKQQGNPRRKKKLSEEEKQELKEMAEDKKKAMMTIYISLALCFIILVSPPYIETKTEIAKKQHVQKQIKIPNVNSFWDDTLPSAHRKESFEDSLPLLNDSFGNIPMELHNYLIRIGEEFNNNWTKSIIKGEGECKIQFTINKDGIIDNKKIIRKSNNETLDDSILLTLSKMTNLEVPPKDYKGERIILSFKVTPNANKVYYPNN